MNPNTNVCKDEPDIIDNVILSDEKLQIVEPWVQEAGVTIDPGL